jgi:surface antigen
MSRTARLLVLVFLLLAVPLATASAAGEHLHWFKKGQCTRYAYQKRPDIVDEGYARHAYLHWDAWEWSGHAKASGFKVDRKPRKGDIAVWQPNVGGATGKGHLAYVEGVTKQHKVKISEVNWNGHHTMTRRTLSATYAKKLEFVHRLSGK